MELPEVLELLECKLPCGFRDSGRAGAFHGRFIRNMDEYICGLAVCTLPTELYTRHVCMYVNFPFLRAYAGTNFK